MTLTRRVLIALALVVAVLVVLIVVLSGRRLERQLGALTRSQLQRDARLLADEWLPGMNADSLADAAGTALGRRVTLVDSAGHVLGDTDFDPPALATLENHSTRPEIVQARDSGWGSAIRSSASTRDRRMYVAARAPLGIARVSVPTAQLDAIVAEARRTVLLSGLVALVVALLAGVVLARPIVRPLVELRDVTRAMASGDLSRRPSLAASGEVGELASAIHRLGEELQRRLLLVQEAEGVNAAMVESLQEAVIAVDAHRNVVRINATARAMLRLDSPIPFPADHLPRERAFRDALAHALKGGAVEHEEITLGARTVALTARPLPEGGAVLTLYDLTAVRRLEAIRRDFVANVSHELKTPLTVISGFADALTSTDVPDDKRRQFLEAIRTHAVRMQQLVDDLLDLSRIESGTWAPQPALVEVATAAADALAPLRAEAERQQLRIDIVADPVARLVWADPTALRQILGNLISNGIRYSGNGGAVTIFSRPQPPGTVVGVTDTGIGIGPEHLTRIFERFYRADPARSRAAGGTGLGLSIVRHLAEAHGGRVWAESTLGRGTTVAVYFPPPPNMEAAAPSGATGSVTPQPHRTRTAGTV